MYVREWIRKRWAKNSWIPWLRLLKVSPWFLFFCFCTMPLRFFLGLAGLLLSELFRIIFRLET